MRLSVEITRVADGEKETFVYDDSGTLADIRYGWREGNDSCDCNRELYFSYERNPAKDPVCGPCTTGRYRVRIFDESGVLIYEDEAMSPPIGTDKEGQGRQLSRVPAPFGGGEAPVDGAALVAGDGVRI